MSMCVSAFEMLYVNKEAIPNSFQRGHSIHHLRYGSAYRRLVLTQPSLDWLQPRRQPTGSGLFTSSIVVPMFKTKNNSVIRGIVEVSLYGGVCPFSLRYMCRYVSQHKNNRDKYVKKKKKV